MIEKDNIENLFKQSLHELEVPLKTSEWQGLSSKLTKLNFLKFGVFHFNIYYFITIVSILITGAAISLHLIFSDFSTEKDTIPKTSLQDIIYESQTEINTPSHDSKQNSEIKPSTSNNESTAGGNTSNNGENSNNVPQTSILKNSGQNSNIPEIHKNDVGNSKINNIKSGSKSSDQEKSIDKEPTVPAANSLQSGKINIDNRDTENQIDSTKSTTKVKTIYLIKQDTIYQYDTIKSKNRRNKRNN
ncbi:MAG: hypothetical protein HY738_23315 [Bacteroidia bacterium]|nr:hypothetical protein [Bacteroidia bacterium]